MRHTTHHAALRYMKSFYVGAGEGVPCADTWECNPTAATATTCVYSPSLAFDKDTDQGAVFDILIPEDRCPHTEMTAKLVWSTLVSRSGLVRWILAYQPGKHWSYLYPSPAPVWPTIRHGGGLTSQPAFGAYYQNITKGILIKSEDLEDYTNLQILVARHASVAEDTYPADAHLLKIVFEYEAWSGNTYIPTGE